MIQRCVVALTLCAAVAAGCSDPPRPLHEATPAPVPTSTAAVDGWSQPAPDPMYPRHGDPNIDVGAYNLKLAWSPDRRVLTGTADLTVRAARPTGEARLDLAGPLTVDEVTVDGRTVSAATHRDDKLTVPLGRVFGVGARFAVRVRYHGTPQRVAFPGSRSDVAGIGAKVGDGGGLAALSEPYGAYSWFPCSDQPSDKAMLDVDVTVPAGWAGVSSGRFAGAAAGAGGTRTYRWRASEPIATYLVAFAVDRFDGLNATGPRGLPVTYWVRPADRDRMWPLLRRTPELVEWLEARLGPYPFGSAGVVVVPDASGLETQTMVTLGPLRGPEALPVLLHELAHQWFGDAVTPRTWQDLWLSEGFATYVQMLFEVDQLGGNRDETLDRWRAADADWRVKAGPPGRYDPAQFAARNVYYGPALMLDEIRERIGDARFDGLLRDWPQRHRHTNQDRASFVAWLNAYAGQDLTPVVDRWLDGP